jgi:hypothetical protein
MAWTYFSVLSHSPVEYFLNYFQIFTRIYNTIKNIPEEAEIGRIKVQGQSGYKVHRIPSQPMKSWVQ